MPERDYILAIDQGTTNSRAMLFHRSGRVISSYDQPLTQFFPRDGWVEQNPDQMVAHTIRCVNEVIQASGVGIDAIACIGLTNQRETTIVWEKSTGKPIYPAIVWQDRRTAAFCERLAQDWTNERIQAKTGLLLDPYFSGTKLAWILNHVPNASVRAQQGELLFGTVDTYLLWHLTEGKSYYTDMTNASRTLLFNIHRREWDTDLCAALNIPLCMLPEVLDNTADFGETAPRLFGRALPILGMVGDQQAATVGQACFQEGMVKSTYGTGCFLLLNTGDKVIQSKQHLLSTIAYSIHGKVTYGLEGSIFSAGVTIKWLRDTLQLIQTAAETETLAKSVPDTGGVYLIPAFTGLGAPYWDAEARGALLGLTRNTQRAHIVRAALEAVAYQTNDLMHAMEKDSGTTISHLRVDGGMTPNGWLMQFLSDTLGISVERPCCVETTALGAAFLAGLQAGLYTSLEDIAACWHSDAIFQPHIDEALRKERYAGWKKAVHRIMTNTTNIRSEA